MRSPSERCLSDCDSAFVTSPRDDGRSEQPRFAVAVRQPARLMCLQATPVVKGTCGKAPRGHGLVERAGLNQSEAPCCLWGAAPGLRSPSGAGWTFARE